MRADGAEIGRRKKAKGSAETHCMQLRACSAFGGGDTGTGLIYTHPGTRSDALKHGEKKTALCPAAECQQAARKASKGQQAW